MLYYSYPAVKYALEYCLERRNYKVGIVPPDIDAVAEDLLALLDYKELDKRLSSIRRGRNIFTINFINGSMIECIRATENARGRAYHLIIVDENIDDDFLNRVLRPMEKLENIERNNCSLRKE